MIYEVDWLNYEDLYLKVVLFVGIEVWSLIVWGWGIYFFLVDIKYINKLNNDYEEVVVDLFICFKWFF